MLNNVELVDHHQQQQQQQEQQQKASVRVVHVERAEGASFGFHLTRGRWDPYPWVSSVDGGSPAEAAGVRSGDCLLEVNGEDVVGRRVADVGRVVRARPLVTLLLWSAGEDARCTPETLCCGPMPNNFQRLSAATAAILSHLECPVCLDTTQPPAHQCDNGHLICLRCRTRTEKCPVCRTRLTRGRCLLADNIYNAIADAFDLQHAAHEVRAARLGDIFRPRKQTLLPDVKVSSPSPLLPPRNKFLARVAGRASSVENLSSRTPRAAGSSLLALDTEFDASLKAKSLSSTEIFRPARSPTISQASSLHNSMDSIANGDDEMLYMCPFHKSCPVKFIKEAEILQHFETQHDGPLIQYFTPYFTVRVDKNDATYLITVNKKYFVLRINYTQIDGEFVLQIWMWLFGSKQLASEYQFKVHVVRIYKANMSLIRTCSPVYSLNSVTWQQMETGTAVVLTVPDGANAEIYVEIGIEKSPNI